MEVGLGQCCAVAWYYLVFPGGRGGEVTSLESSGAGFWLAGGGRAQGSEFLGARRPLAGGVSAERCGGWWKTAGRKSKSDGGAPLALPEWVKNRKRPNLAGLGKLC